MGGHLSEGHPIFVGMKMDGTLRRLLRGLEGSDRRYVSDDDPAFLMICRLGDQEYVGKRVDDRLTTDRIDDVRRNVLSILQRLCPDVRLPAHFEILTWVADADAAVPAALEGGPEGDRS